ncbi:MAG: PadR family transcriptional regulator, partial [Acidobacteriota bacterium]
RQLAAMLTFCRSKRMLRVEPPHMAMTAVKSDIPQGTLDLMVLQSLASLGTLHGYGIARRIEQMSENSLSLKQGTIYPALVRLQEKGWIAAEWGISDNNRQAKFYAITKSGRKQLVIETAHWERIVGTVARLLKVAQ